MYFPDQQLMFIHIPKCAGSFFLHHLSDYAKQNGIAPPGESLESIDCGLISIEERTCWLPSLLSKQHLRLEEAYELLASLTLPKNLIQEVVSVVRNPFTHAISLYHQTVKRSSRRGFARFKEYSPTDMSFRNFLRFLAEVNHLGLPQGEYLKTTKASPPLSVFKLEEISSCFDFLESKGMDVSHLREASPINQGLEFSELSDESARTHNIEMFEPSASVFGAEESSLILELYAPDFDQFGYSPHPEDAFPR